jgi:hypothetical protein
MHRTFTTAAFAALLVPLAACGGNSLAEYDYVHGSVLVRVSRYLTPEQAAQYESAAAALD